MKIKDIINEAFGEKRVKDPYSYDFERDPETGEYTGRTEPDPSSFTKMLQGVANRLGAGSGSQWVDAPETPEKQKIKRYTVKPGTKLVVQTNDGRQYTKMPAKPADKDPTGNWFDPSGKQIFDEQSKASLESLAYKNGKIFGITQASEPAAATSTDTSQIEVPDTTTTQPTTSTSSPLHPDVSVLQPYPLVMQYKGKRFEMDDFGEFHPFGTNGKVTPALQAFLTKERSKL